MFGGLERRIVRTCLAKVPFRTKTRFIRSLRPMDTTGGQHTGGGRHSFAFQWHTLIAQKLVQRRLCLPGFRHVKSKLKGATGADVHHCLPFSCEF